MRFRLVHFLVCLIFATTSSRLLAQDIKPVPGSQRTVLVIHGGAGVLDEVEMKKENLIRAQYEQVLCQALVAGYKLWKEEKSSVCVVEAAIRIMEDCELFNAGRGAALNSDGQAELDAAIMEGDMKAVENKALGKMDPRKRAGAVASVAHIKNPISAARAVMEMQESRHVMLVGEGAEVFALSNANASQFRIERVQNTYFWTDRRVKQVLSKTPDQASVTVPGLCKSATADGRFGTVGAVSVSKNKKLAVGTSTGGLANKMRGRVGDSPIIGGGTYADDRACGVSCTGTGEVFIRHAVAHDIVAKMYYGRQTICQAVNEAINQLPDEIGGVGGLIALDPEGNHAFGMSPNSIGMYRGYVTESGEIYVAIYKPRCGEKEFVEFHAEKELKAGR